MQTTKLGNRAEQAAAEYLVREGYEIIGRNWKRPRGEIDIVAVKDKTVYFVEVKYRAHDYAGSGLEYITAKKYKQMRFAANLWLLENHWHGQYQLSALEVSGESLAVTAFIDALFEF